MIDNVMDAGDFQRKRLAKEVAPHVAAINDDLAKVRERVSHLIAAISQNELGHEASIFHDRLRLVDHLLGSAATELNYSHKRTQGFIGQQRTAR